MSLVKEFDNLKKQVQKLLEDVEKLRKKIPKEKQVKHIGVLTEMPKEKQVKHIGVLTEHFIESVDKKIELIDLTEDEGLLQTNPLAPVSNTVEDPVVPTVTEGMGFSKMPPELIVDVDKTDQLETRVTLSLNFSKMMDRTNINGFEVFTHSEEDSISSGLWRKIGFIGLRQTLTYGSFHELKNYSNFHLSVRAVYRDGSYGHFSNPVSIML